MNSYFERVLMTPTPFIRHLSAIYPPFIPALPLIAANLAANRAQGKAELAEFITNLTRTNNVNILPWDGSNYGEADDFLVGNVANDASYNNLFERRAA